MRGCTRGVRTEGGSQPEGAPQGKPRGKGRAEAEGALRGEQSAGSSFFTREGAVTYRTPTSVQFPDTRRKISLVSVCQNFAWISTGVWRRETKPDGGRGRVLWLCYYFYISYFVPYTEQKAERIGSYRKARR